MKEKWNWLIWCITRKIPYPYICMYKEGIYLFDKYRLTFHPFYLE